jgi:hypothetical protein
MWSNAMWFVNVDSAILDRKLPEYYLLPYHVGMVKLSSTSEFYMLSRGSKKGFRQPKYVLKSSMCSH